MFTLKHVMDGSENIVSAEEVTFNDYNALNAASAPSQVSYLAGKEWKDIVYGIVYVMNDAGRTVATYDMRGMSGSAVNVKAPIAGGSITGKPISY